MEHLCDGFKNVSQIINQKLARPLQDPEKPMTQSEVDGWVETADKTIAELSNLIIATEEQFACRGAVCEEVV